MRSALVAVVVTLSALSGGCNLYWHHSGDDDQCLVNGAEDDVAPLDLRNPETGECQSFGYPGGYCCPGDAPCAEPASGVALPAWPSCSGPCEGLAESTCLSTDTCHAAYVDLADGKAPVFDACWDSVSGFAIPPNQNTACASLDAEGCIFRDDCISLMSNVPNSATSQFSACAPEPLPTRCDDASCDSGSHCEQRCTGPNCRAFCVPDEICDLACPSGATCVETCDPTTQQCTASCVSPTACGALTTETDCKLRTDCEAIYKGDNCTCTPTTCTCATETYDHCQELADPPL